MDTGAHRVAVTLGRACLLAIAAAALSGCQLRPTLLSAHSERAGEDEIVHVNLRSVDAQNIKTRQVYFSVVVANCPGDTDGFPMEPYIDGKRASEFEFATAGNSVDVVGRIPSKILDSYSHPCAFLRGGGYFTGTIRSAPIVIERGLPAPPVAIPVT